eukprot:s2951_g11.t1
MQAAIDFCASHSPEVVARERSDFLRRAVAKSKELEEEERKLKMGLSERRRTVLAPKRMKLFQWMMEISEFGDKGLFEDVCSGFDLTGTLPESNTFAKKMRPASLPTDALRNVADKARQALLISMKGSGDAELDEGVYMATMKELDKGFLRGPVAPESLPPGATLTRRFGVVQGGKVRPIDDYKASLVNASVTQPEMVCLHSVDHIAGLGAQLIRAHAMRGKNVSLLAKCWDLASAYKQVPLSEDAFKYDSFLVVFNPRTGKGEIFQQLVLPFGSIASVTAFLRCALAIWHIGSSLLHYTWTSYFDDFLSLTEESLGPHLEMCVSLFFQLLGWGLSLDKLVPYSTCCKVLGVELDLTKTPGGTFAIANTVSRKDELKDTLQHILNEGFLGRSEAERLRGRLQFASNQLFGRRFRNCLRELNKHINRGMKTLSADLRSALTALKCLIDANVPRGYSGIGGQLYDMNGECLGFFSEKVSDSLLESIKRPDQLTVIFELEGLAVAAGLQVFSQIITGKRVIVFTDNQAVQSCIVKCKSANEHMDSMIRRICSLEESMGLLAWLERVPSQSNPADEMSRSHYHMFYVRSSFVAFDLTIMAASSETPDNADVSIASSPATPRPSSFPDAATTPQLPEFVCTSFQARAVADNAAASASAEMMRTPPSFQEILLPTLTLTVQISKAIEVAETLQILRDSIPTECATAYVAFERSLEHVQAAIKDLHVAHDRALNLVRTEFQQHSSDFGRLPLMDAD